MIISFLGDSITQGVGASDLSKCYVSLVGKMLGCTVHNCGISGTRIARRREYNYHISDLDFNARVPILDKKADYIVVFGGTNDHGHGDASLGDYYGKDVYTFFGAMRTLIESLSLEYGKEKLRFILPCRKFDENAFNPYAEEKLTLKDFVNAEKKILEEYEIPYLNLFEEWVEAPTSQKDEGYFKDGIHPNDRGHQEIAEKVCEFLKKNF